MSRWSEAVSVLTAVVDDDYPLASEVLADTDPAVVALRLAELVVAVANHEHRFGCGHPIEEVLHAYGLNHECHLLERGEPWEEIR